MAQVNRLVLSATAVLSASLGVASLGLAQHQHDPDEAAHAHAVAAQEGEQGLEVGKNQEVEFKVETLVGETRLEPGHYRLQHRVDGSEHFVHFTGVTKDVDGRGRVTKEHPGEVNCRLEPLAEKASATTLHFRKEEAGRRLIRILIRGENVAHVF